MSHARRFSRAEGEQQQTIDAVESGIDANEQEKIAFFDLAERLANASDPAEQECLKKELARLTFDD